MAISNAVAKADPLKGLLPKLAENGFGYIQLLS
jgi:hypothetical protein